VGKWESCDCASGKKGYGRQNRDLPDDDGAAGAGNAPPAGSVSVGVGMGNDR